MSNTELKTIASTRRSCAEQRAENLAILGTEWVIELCVGPSMRTLIKAYTNIGIRSGGNDIDPKWKETCHSAVWRIGDALTVNLDGFDTAVFAPPLSKGFSGKREDSLMIDEVQPSYRDFLSRTDLPRLIVLVLPGRSLSTAQDVMQYYRLRNQLAKEYHIDMDELKDERGRVTKYVDLYLRKRLQ